MYYEEFAEDVRARVEKIATEELGECVVNIRNVVKNNSVRRKAISIVKKDEKATPTIYIREYYDDYKEGRDIDDICDEIFETYKKCVKSFYEEIEIGDFLDFDRVKDRVYIKLINRKMNKVLLRDVPSKEYLDLNIVYYVSLTGVNDSSATVLVHNHHLKHWNLTPKQLHEIACKKTLEQLNPVILSMEEIIKDMVLDNILANEDILEEENVYEEDSEQRDELVSEETVYGGKTKEEIDAMVQEEIDKVKRTRPMEMYVLTNEKKTFGAACILYPGVLKDFAIEKDMDFYVIPSSVHEVILVPKKKSNASKLNDILNDVNKNNLDPVEMLSDHIYEYSVELDEVTI